MVTTIKYAKYMRYSRVDGDREKESIQNQDKIIENYIKDRETKYNEKWLLVGEYVDLDYTGSNFNRPEFLKMKEEVENDKIDVIISKDASRFGRNVATEVYFEEIFPKYRTRFIGVVDNVDTASENQAFERKIRGLMNENYCSDISQKVKSSLKTKMIEGKFIGASPPYGFERDLDDKHKLIVDEEVRPIILKIVDLYLKGYGFSAIAKILNAEKIPSPSAYKKMKKSNYKNPRANRRLWSPSTIRKILTEPIYNGTLVQGKHPKINYKINSRKKSGESELIKVDNAVEKIIDDETFELVGKKINSRSKNVKNNDSPSVLPDNVYSGLVYCEDCGSKMVYRSDRDMYMCGTYAKYGKKYCSNHNIKTKVINEVVIEQLNLIIKLTIDIRTLLNDIKKKYQEVSGKDVIEIKRKKRENRLKTLKESLKILREEYADGIIDQEEYKETRSEYVNEINTIENELGKLQVSSSKESVINDWEEKVKDLEKFYNNFLKINKIDREIALKLIDTITVGTDQISEIKFAGASPFELAQELKSEISSVAL
ncbi:recombinase family protein [Natranaerobius thermophilus]|uniref:Recombinase n=1 Tax=Natranaerobius thermophilus (strain ATCC BAA-1301 / DSM 18059 / JW/NM-WN-LF) TaxID=457570 RepID=B2A5F2_NATTJ|nr:recombinase family protein [Natranaerobius thermophilus]ACB83990.1 Recombinase [Natranaerobius thermophilus JW/NM-WN-LF]